MTADKGTVTSMYTNLGLAIILAMKSPYILRESTLKRDRSGKQKRVETLLIESFSDIATRSHYSQALIIRHQG